MATILLDTSGLECPKPILKIAAKLSELKEGDILEVIADCRTFESDVKLFCNKLHKKLLFIEKNGNGKMKCQIQC
jgi:tRNA 2-thiouridine synthesizing protein A